MSQDTVYRDENRGLPTPHGLDGIRRIPIDSVHGGGVNKDVLDFSASINPLGPPAAALAAYHSAAGTITSYPSPYPHKLSRRIAEWLDVAPNEVIVGNGSTQLIHLFARVFPLRFPYIAIPTFSEFANALVLSGRKPYALELQRDNAFAIQRSDVVHALSHPSQAIFVGRPNSPTGSMIALEVAEEIARECERFHAFCVCDEAFIDFVSRDESLLQLMGSIPARRRKGLIVVGSLTKIFAIPGLRVGFMAGPADLIEEMRRHLEPWSLNTVAEQVSLACLDAGGEFVQKTRVWLVSERAYLHARLESIAGLTVFPSVANFLMFEIPEAGRPTTLGEFMLSRGIAVRDLRALPGCAPGDYRVAVRMREDNDRLIAAARAYFETNPE